MTELIESCSTVHSPASSDKEGQPLHQVVHEHFTANIRLEMRRETWLYFASVKLQFPLQVHSEEEELGGHPGAKSSADPGAEGSPEGHPVWLNSLVGRIFWDFLREKYWTDQVAQKIQKKLSKIKVKMRLSVFYGKVNSWS